MNKIFTILFLTFCSLSVSAQQFSQYNTGTLYDSFENPSQRSFIPDSSRAVAFNFFVPNFDANLYLTGHIQRPLKSRAFASPAFYNTSSLRIGQNALNHFNANANAYAIMLKFFTSLNGNVEMGFSAQTRVESRGLATDESVAFLDGPSNFAYNNYDNIFNDHYMIQMYDQLSYTYREQVNKQLSIGFKLSYLSGIQYDKIDVGQSSLQINRDPVDPNNDNADVYMQGRYYRSYVPGRLDGRDFLPTFRNPGAAISLGATFRTEDGILIQGNIKDLGFIHWNKRSTITDFDNTTNITDITSEHRDENIYNAVYALVRGNGVVTSFNTKTNAKAELSVSKSYWLDDEKTFRYFPTVVAQKEMFYPGFTGALVNSVQKNNLIATLTATYDDYKLFNIGAQIMVKSPNAEFFIGSERLVNTGRFTLAALNNTNQINHVGNYSGADVFLGFSLKFGRVIEHPMNSSYIPMGEKGFFGRLFGRIFKTDN
ncbi:hypothetical protein SAMN05192574_104574 [Mucilaginibacter gossypiicola]|uniref:DUF5723 domain-containing protein n=1 Tax=Mucilaginibacter gossypiicola TaxID=551995 RepID=A0A1H8KE11_9SPHI|nr:DUF5723 family protein [Mucilaginibacter gossypiicola]SEN91213.1 hypothetical protein SAMN05192574_104574 [Mucilaginibacter gossypiicola]